MKQKLNNKKLNIDRKTVAKLDQNEMASLNGGQNEMAVTTADIPTSIDSPQTTTFVPTWTTLPAPTA
ncbi:class I lanthipeptide [Pedobacter sp. AW1-32]|uniref:class I lanthipeptide n=1 Tax=Pedobacter sp. AW1-32 TaxID=3383026 RepID=UPI003FED5E1A